MTNEQFSLFDNDDPSKSPSGGPLAALLRPARWEEFEGFERLDPSIQAVLRRGGSRPPSLVLWGPPGSGKTTFARLLAHTFSCHFVEFSAVLSGVKEVRDVVTRAQRTKTPTLLFVDEIHRFNKAQQDAFLPHVEAGTISLVGATTENPSFALTTALLSRVKVIVLPPLSPDHLRAILGRAETLLKKTVEPDAKDLLVQWGGGDARRMLNLLQVLAENTATESVSRDAVVAALGSAHALRYDREGEEHYNIASAFIKSLRGSDPDAALYWGLRMLESGEPPLFLFRRLIIFASEDIGNADPRALAVATDAVQAFERVGLPEGRIPLAQCITYLASAPKSNRSYVALNLATEAVKNHPHAEVPLHLRNASTGLMKQLGYGKEYRYPHDFPEGFVPGEQYLPDELRNSRFYEPSGHGLEGAIKERLGRVRGKTAGSQ